MLLSLYLIVVDKYDAIFYIALQWYRSSSHQLAGQFPWYIEIFQTNAVLCFNSKMEAIICCNSRFRNRILHAEVFNLNCGVCIGTKLKGIVTAFSNISRKIMIYLQTDSHFFSILQVEIHSASYQACCGRKPESHYQIAFQNLAEGLTIATKLIAILYSIQPRVSRQ